MEVLKKTVKRIMAVNATTGNSHVIVPDIGIQYVFLIGLTQESHDMGFFDAYTPETGTTSLLGLEAVVSETTLETPAVIISNPVVTTGTAAVGTVKAVINSNKVNNKGDSAIMEYGIIYSDVDSTASNLLYDAAGVVVKSVKADIAISTNFSQQVLFDDISDNTTYYYRAFAKNSSKIGYGTVKSFIWKLKVIYTTNPDGTVTVTGIGAQVKPEVTRPDTAL